MKKISILLIAMAPVFGHALSLVENATNESLLQSALPSRVTSTLSTSSLPTRAVTSTPVVSSSLLGSRNAALAAAIQQANAEQALRSELASGVNVGLNNGLSQVAQAQSGNNGVKAQADQMLRDYAASFQQTNGGSSNLVLPSTTGTTSTNLSVGNTNIRYIAPQAQVLGYASANPILATGQVIVQNTNVSPSTNFSSDITSMTYTDKQAVNPITVGFGEGQSRPGAYDAMSMFFGGDWYRKTALSIGGQSSDPWNQQIETWLKQYDSINKYDLSAVEAWRANVGNVLSGAVKSNFSPLDANNRPLVDTSVETVKKVEPVVQTVKKVEPVVQTWTPPTKEEAAAAIQASPFYSSIVKIKPVTDNSKTGISSWVR